MHLIPCQAFILRQHPGIALRFARKVACWFTSLANGVLPYGRPLTEFWYSICWGRTISAKSVCPDLLSPESKPQAAWMPLRLFTPKASRPGGPLRRLAATVSLSLQFSFSPFGKTYTRKKPIKKSLKDGSFKPPVNWFFSIRRRR